MTPDVIRYGTTWTLPFILTLQDTMLSRLTGDCQNQASSQILSFSFTQTTLPSTDFHAKFVILSLEGLSLH